MNNIIDDINYNDTNEKEDRFVIGSGQDLFHFVIRLEQVSDIQHLFRSTSTKVSDEEAQEEATWLSYGCFGIVIQTPKFHPSAKENEHSDHNVIRFPPTADTFVLQSSHEELSDYFFSHCEEQEKEQQPFYLQIHVCQQEKLIGTCKLNLHTLLFSSDRNNSSKISEQDPYKPRIVRDEFSIEPYFNDEGEETGDENQEEPRCAKVSLTIVLAKIEKNDNETCNPTIPSNITMINHHNNEKAIQTTLTLFPEGFPDNNNIDMNTSDNKKRIEWEEWRHQEELKWHQTLRSKEESAMRALKNQAIAREKEREEIMVSQKLEYSRLENRLRKALSEVDKKERVLQQEYDKKEFSLQQKTNEMNAQHRLIREETKHILELERTKLKACVERAENAEREVSKYKEQMHKLEEDFQKLKEKHRKTSPELSQIQEIANLKAKLLETENTIQSERIEKKKLELEKDQLRETANRFARKFKREKEKKESQERKKLGELKLEYIEKQKQFVLEGEMSELHRIKNELSSLNNNHECSRQSTCGSMFNTPPPPTTRSSYHYQKKVPMTMPSKSFFTNSSPSFHSIQQCGKENNENFAPRNLV